MANYAGGHSAGLPPDAPALPGEWREESGRAWAIERARSGQPSDPLLFALKRHHPRMHDGRSVDVAARERIRLVLEEPHALGHPVAMAEPGEAQGAETSGARRARIARAVPAEPVRGWVPPHKRDSAPAADTQSPQSGVQRAPSTNRTHSQAAGTGAPAVAPPSAGAPVFVSGNRQSAAGSRQPKGKRPLGNGDAGGRLVTGAASAGRKGVAALRDPHPRTSEPPSSRGAAEECNLAGPLPPGQSDAAAAPGSTTRAGSRGASREPRPPAAAVGPTRSPPSASPAAASAPRTPVLDLAFRDADGFRWVIGPGGWVRLSGGLSAERGGTLAAGCWPPAASFNTTVPVMRRPVTMRRVRDVVQAHYELGAGELESASRSTRIVKPRQTAMWLCRTLTKASLPEIGRCLGGRDHTTVMHAVMTVDAKRTVDPAFAAEVDGLVAQIRGDLLLAVSS